MEKCLKFPKKSGKKVLVAFSSLRLQMLVCYWCVDFALGKYADVIVFESNSISLTLVSQEVFVFGKPFKSFSGTTLFLVSGLTAYQTVSLKNTCLTTTFYSSLGCKSTKICHLEECRKYKLLSFFFGILSYLVRFNIKKM